MATEPKTDAAKLRRVADYFDAGAKILFTGPDTVQRDLRNIANHIERLKWIEKAAQDPRFIDWVKYYLYEDLRQGIVDSPGGVFLAAIQPPPEATS